MYILIEAFHIWYMCTYQQLQIYSSIVIMYSQYPNNSSTSISYVFAHPLFCHPHTYIILAMDTRMHALLAHKVVAPLKVKYL